MPGVDPAAEALRVPADCVGRAEEASEIAQAEPLQRLAGVLEADWPLSPGDPVPPGWHWAYFLPRTRQGRLGPEGHAGEGLLPPLRGLRRMWAGSRFDFTGLLRIGAPLIRRSRIRAAEVKRGRSGPFILLSLEHEIAGPDGSLREGQDLVFRPAAGGPASAPPSASPPSPRPDFERELRPDPVLLFRFSAVTFNAHRIHYDRPYATGLEGYPDLVVHGPLQALLMLDLVHRARPEARVAGFTFRAERPAFLPHALSIRGRASAGGFDLWIESAGLVTSRGRVEG